jgi:hypothetical protein
MNISWKVTAFLNIKYVLTNQNCELADGYKKIYPKY